MRDIKKVASCEFQVASEEKIRKVASCEFQVASKEKNTRCKEGCRESVGLPVGGKYKIIQLTNPPIYQLTN